MKKSDIQKLAAESKRLAAESKRLAERQSKYIGIIKLARQVFQHFFEGKPQEFSHHELEHFLHDHEN